jgi:hypothetical protein
MATQLVPMKGNNEEVFYIEVDEERRIPVPDVAGPYAASIKIPNIEKFAQVAEFVASRADEIGQSIARLAAASRPDKLTVTFAVALEGKAHALILLEGSAKASVQVSCEWVVKKIID